MPHSCSCRGTQCTLHPQFGLRMCLRCMVWEYAEHSAIVHINAPFLDIFGCARQYEQALLHSLARKLAAARHNPSYLDYALALQKRTFYQTNRRAKHGMPTRHQFTNLPLFIAFSFLGLTRAALEGPISNPRERVADIDGGQPRAAIEGIIANLRDRVGDVD